MKIGIIGASGFIGKNCTKYFLEKEYKVIGTYHSGKINIENKNLSTKFLDLTDKTTFDGIEDVDHIIDCGAITEKSFKYPKKHIEVNTLGTLNLIEYCNEYDLPLLFLSTVPVNNKEGTSGFPHTPYGLSKLNAEFFASKYDFAAIARLTSVFGPHQKDHKFIPSTIRKAVNDETIKIIKGEPKQWLYVKDVVRSFDRIINKQSFIDFNIVPEKSYCSRDVVGIILNVMNKTHLLELEENGKFDNNYQVESKNLDQIDWTEKYSIREGIKKTIKWFKNNKNWWFT